MSRSLPPARPGRGPGLRRARPLPAQPAPTPTAPAVAALVLAVLGATTALLQNHRYSLLAYGIVLVAGFALIYTQRHLANRATISHHSTRAQPMPLIERLSIWALLAACCCNGLVIALHVSRFGWGF
ncbi:hypothetical protein [Arachnia propionica]|uniref:Uncharacterized protein n=1 Tax=Arachnia propionica TaxID=1750 RepID=A0A3P1WP67_9ACTN|nr:hypothetical protein [Arachnia propionica]RRD47628.1 hypothetical protein EII35_14780 [Arachnia propionica]